MLSRLLVLLAALVALFCVFIATRPGPYEIERTIAIRAPVAEVYRHIEDLQRWPEWSPWEELDPQVQRTFSGPKAGAGARLRWQGNTQVGRGQLEISAATPPSHARFTTVFEEPWSATMESDFQLRAASEGTQVTWVLSGTRRFWAKLFTLFYDLDQRAGEDLDKGLARLKALVEH